MKSLPTHVVMHPFDVGDVTLHIGELVDASSWKNVDKLVSVKYLRLATPADIARALRPVVDSPSQKKALKKFVLKKK